MSETYTHLYKSRNVSTAISMCGHVGTHGIAPHPIAKKKPLRYSIAAIALLAGGGLDALVGGGYTLRSAPTIMNMLPMPKAETKSERLRPKVSKRKNTKMVVAMTFMTPKMPDARSEIVVPVYPICASGQHVHTPVKRENTHRCEDLRRVVDDGVLAAPLLQHKDRDCDDEADELAFAQESLLRTQSLPRLALFRNRRLNLRHLFAYLVGGRGQVAEVREVRDGLVEATLGREPSRRLFDGKQA